MSEQAYAPILPLGVGLVSSDPLHWQAMTRQDDAFGPWVPFDPQPHPNVIRLNESFPDHPLTVHRLAYRMRLEAVAARIGFADQTIRAWMRGDWDPPANAVRALARLFSEDPATVRGWFAGGGEG
jgi:hypothetical protein